MRRATAFFLLLLIPAASLFAQDAAIKMEGYPVPGATAIVRLLSPGDAPRAALRFVVPASHNEHVDLAMQMSMAMEMAGNSMPINMPTMTFGCDMAVTGVAANGDISYSMVFANVTLGSGGDQAVIGAVQDVIAQLKGLKGDATVSDRGFVRSMTVDLGKTQTPQLAQMMDSLSSQMQSLSIPFPEEEVGVGARWEVRQAVVLGGVTSFQRAEYRVTAVDGKAVTLNVTAEQKAPAQPVSNPAFPADANVRLQAMTGSGSGAITVRLDGLVPTGTMGVDSTSTMEMAIGGSTQTMATHSSIKMTMTLTGAGVVKRP